MKSTLHYISLLILASVLTSGALFGQCDNSIISNGSFEEGTSTGWGTWHNNSPNSYSFETSTEANTGSSSAAINILVPTDQIPGTQGAEYNSRPQTNPVVAGEEYTIRFFAKSTVDSTKVTFFLKDEFDGFKQLHGDTDTVGTEWTEITSTWTADSSRADIHLEIKVYNADFDQPYSLYIDDVSVCPPAEVVSSNTCADNLVANPGFEDGATTSWGTWHGGTESDYAFSTGTEGYVGNASAKISVLKPGAELNGTGEFNSRPQVSPVVAGQNYEVSLYAKSTLADTKLAVFVKDEFDGFATIGNVEMEVGTEWTKVSFTFENEVARDDVHVEIKAISKDFTEAYDIWIDEVSICAVEGEPGDGGGEEVPTPTVFGESSTTVTCSSNLSQEFAEDDMMNDGMGWDIFDGNDTADVAVFELDPVLPYSGDNSLRIDVNADNDVANFHHRFGQDITLESGKEYTITMWMRSNVPAGDSLRAFTRVVRDPEFDAQFAVNFVTTSNDWLNYSYTFVAGDDWDNGFVEIKFLRMNGFTAAYSVWVDDIQLCDSGDAITPTNDLADLGVSLTLAPNPSVPGINSHLNLISERSLTNAGLTLVDMLGRNVWSQSTNIISGEQRIEIPTGGLAAGMYFLNIHHRGNVKNLKLQVSGSR
ncbi:carbohydrate binding domain-containing protein [Neolewinella antarctica]|uniref:CBM-cenC domain-containing protein n=1 Tax=Neolewinella antarctica TaxID=442734 RepID=A0ABX0XFZ1_9BACT|nr:carbohydrate binding domain-containing protein [Neolewinella antarctica]NJC28238.1 hypothetical protein [Neolewinella antarctica]